MTEMWGREQDQDGRLGWDRGRDWGDSGRCSGHGRTEQGRLILFPTPTPRPVIGGLLASGTLGGDLPPSFPLLRSTYRIPGSVYSVESFTQWNKFPLGVSD